MIKLIKKLRRDERGNIVIITAASMPLLMGAAGLAVDTIQWSLWKRQLQRAADSAAMAGVYERVRADGATSGVTAAVLKDLELNNNTGIDLLNTVVPTYPADTREMEDQVSVRLDIRKALAFSSMFMSATPIITASATAASVGGGASPCVRSLESTTAMGIQGSGNGTVETDCPWMTNSVGNRTAVAKGSSTIIAPSISSAGAIAESANFRVGNYYAYSPALPDPFSNITPDPNEMRCAVSTSTQRQRVNGVWTDVQVHTPLALTESTNIAAARDAQGRPANCFSSMSVGSNQTLTLPAGPLYINGGGANIQGTLNATSGTTIVLTNRNATGPIGSFDMNAQAALNIVAPTTGTFAGIAVYQDRRATDAGGATQTSMPANSPNKINGGSSSNITGVFYFPNQQLTFNGNGNMAWQCMQLVARRIQFSGNNRTQLTNDEDRCGTTGIPLELGARRIRLVA